jgi:hypothetical protein
MMSPTIKEYLLQNPIEDNIYRSLSTATAYRQPKECKIGRSESSYRWNTSQTAKGNYIYHTSHCLFLKPIGPYLPTTPTNHSPFNVSSLIKDYVKNAYLTSTNVHPLAWMRTYNANQKVFFPRVLVLTTTIAGSIPATLRHESGYIITHAYYWKYILQWLFPDYLTIDAKGRVLYCWRQQQLVGWLMGISQNIDIVLLRLILEEKYAQKKQPLAYRQSQSSTEEQQWIIRTAKQSHRQQVISSFP